MFGFPKSDRPKNFQFNRNFLKSVIFQVKFDNNESVLSSKEKLIKKLEGSYPVHNVLKGVGFGFKLGEEKTPIIKEVKDHEDAIEFKSKDSNRILNISGDAITLTNLGKGYSNFEGFLDEVVKLRNVFDLCGIKLFTRVAIRKINIIEFTPPGGNDSMVLEFLPVIFNQAMIDNLMVFPGREMIKQGVTTLNYVSGDDRMNLRYGLLPLNPKTNRHSVLLDVDVYTLEKELSTNKLEPKLVAINKEIFDIFNWSLSDEAKEFLNSPENE